MENNLKWHYKNVDKKELIAAKKEINNEKWFNKPVNSWGKKK